MEKGKANKIDIFFKDKEQFDIEKPIFYRLNTRIHDGYIDSIW